MNSAAPSFEHAPGCRYIDYPYRGDLEFRLSNQRKRLAERAAQSATPITKLREREVSRPPELDSFKHGPIEGTLICDYCGSVIADLEKHLEWHLSLGDARQTAPELIRG